MLGFQFNFFKIRAALAIAMQGKESLLDVRSASRHENAADLVELIPRHPDSADQSAASTSVAGVRERKLMYVGIPRAKGRLTLLWSAKPKRYGEIPTNQPSPFLHGPPQDDLHWQGFRDGQGSDPRNAEFAHDEDRRAGGG